MNRLLNQLERKFGKYAIRDLIRYVMVIYGAGAALSFIYPDVYERYLSLNFDAVFHGQVWRLFTYLLEPLGAGGSMGNILISILFFLIEINLFLLFGRALEQAWGAFRFNMYFLSGYLFNIIAALILYLSPLKVSGNLGGMRYIYWAMFFAFALVNPNMELLLYFVLPIKVKWLALLDALYLLYQIVSYLRTAVLYYLEAGRTTGLESIYAFKSAGIAVSLAVSIIVAMLNFLIYFFATRDYRRVSPKEIHRRREYKRKSRPRNLYEGGARHRCAICGRTELDAPELEFRYCSKCEGNYEYCSEHLFTHEHVKK